MVKVALVIDHNADGIVRPSPIPDFSEMATTCKEETLTVAMTKKDAEASGEAK